MKHTVLFICIHNSARSQMAEAFLNHLAGDQFIARSAGLEPGKLNPAVVQVMAELGIDIAKNQVKSITTLLQKHPHVDTVITVCDGASAERCPMIPGFTGNRLHWEFDDPSAAHGSAEEVLQTARRIRNEIKERIMHFIATTP